MDMDDEAALDTTDLRIHRGGLVTKPTLSWQALRNLRRTWCCCAARITPQPLTLRAEHQA